MITATYTLFAATHDAGLGRRDGVHELGEPGSPVALADLPATARDWLDAQRGADGGETLIYVAPPGVIPDDDYPSLTVTSPSTTPSARTTLRASRVGRAG